MTVSTQTAKSGKFEGGMSMHKNRISIFVRRRHIVTIGALTLAISFCLMLLLATAPASASKPLLQMIYRGEYASVSWYEDLGDGAYRQGSLSVGRSEGSASWSNPGREKTTDIFLSYFIEEGNWETDEWTIVAEGWGVIPDRDFIVTGKTASLNTDTSTNPDFTVLEGPSGIIACTWERTRASWSHNNGKWEDHYGNIVSRGMGQYMSASAMAQGAVYDYEVSSEQSASIDRNYGVTIMIEYASPT